MNKDSLLIKKYKYDLIYYNESIYSSKVNN